MPCDKKSPLNRSQGCVSVSPGESSAVPKICKPPMEIVVVPDTVHVYCTEDTPAGISPVGSQSNLSVLSMPSVPEDIEKIEPIKSSELECHRNDLSDESYNLSDEDEKILDECIQSGIPKVYSIIDGNISDIISMLSIKLHNIFLLKGETNYSTSNEKYTLCEKT